MAMQWEQLLSPIRFGKPKVRLTDPITIRTEFQRDYDRLIFSSPFRRLQNKTQVFPLPGSVFVHNRLTHSLEVASVGRSLGNEVSGKLKKKYGDGISPVIDEIGSIVAAGSLSHDMGNPPFGHAGEEAISSFFTQGAGKDLEAMFTQAQWADLTNFEGNANALRLLTHRFNGRREGGFVLTYATLASLIKYPYSAECRSKKNKYGYFDSELAAFNDIAETTGMLKHATKPNAYVRHPLVYLVEAADDISYLIMDIEDGHKLGIFTSDETTDLLTAFFDKKNDAWFFDKFNEVYEEVTDANERIAFLRATVINHLVGKAAHIFVENEQTILAGLFEGSLVDYLTGAPEAALKSCGKIAFEKVYKSRSVIEVEITGYNVLSTLLEEFTHAMFHQESNYSKKLIALLPMQYKENHQNNYAKVRSVLDFVSGMTDLYAMDLYKLIKGIGN